MAGSGPPALLPASVRAYCSHEAIKLLYQFWYGPPIGPQFCLSVLAVLAAAAWPSRRTAILVLLLRMWDSLERMPIMWDSYYWCLQTDLGLLLLLLFRGAGDETAVALSWAEIVRSQLVYFYGAAAFFKINTAFLDHRYSCAPIFFLTLLPTLGLPPQPQLADVIARLAPAVTIGGEVAISMLLATRRTARYGVVFALLLHMGIALTPPPNNATPFSLACAVRLLVIVPRGLQAAAAEVAEGSAAGRATAALALAASAICSRVAYVRQLYHPPVPAPPAVDWWVVLYAALSVLCCRAVMIEEAGDKSARQPPAAAAAAPASIRTPLVVLAALYAFAGPILGVQDVGACNMYSNLRAHGGSNHLLVPTLLLARLVPEASRASAFAVVRVEACTSDSINAIYPGEISTHMADDERSLLRGVGQSGRMFNGAKAVILTPASTPGPNGGGGGPFVRYTVPALELRRLLAEARASNESFSMTYTVLDGASGDEAWRRHGTGRTVKVEEDGRGGASCAVMRGGSLFGGSDECAPTELARLPPPGPIARKLLLQQSYPIVDDDGGEEMPCFGP